MHVSGVCLNAPKYLSVCTGFVDKILSLSLWAPLSNISFACYLIHPIIIILYNGKQETTMHYTDFNFVSILSK